MPEQSVDERNRSLTSRRTAVGVGILVSGLLIAVLFARTVGSQGHAHDTDLGDGELPVVTRHVLRTPDQFPPSLLEGTQPRIDQSGVQLRDVRCTILEDRLIVSWEIDSPYDYETSGLVGLSAQGTILEFFEASVPPGRSLHMLDSSDSSSDAQLDYLELWDTKTEDEPWTCGAHLIAFYDERSNVATPDMRGTVVGAIG